MIGHNAHTDTHCRKVIIADGNHYRWTNETGLEQIVNGSVQECIVCTHIRWSHECHNTTALTIGVPDCDVPMGHSRLGARGSFECSSQCTVDTVRSGHVRTVSNRDTRHDTDRRHQSRLEVISSHSSCFLPHISFLQCLRPSHKHTVTTFNSLYFPRN